MGCALAPCCRNCRTSNLWCSQVVMKMMRTMENGFSTEEMVEEIQVATSNHIRINLSPISVYLCCENSWSHDCYRFWNNVFAQACHRVLQLANGSTIGAAQEAIFHNITNQAIPNQRLGKFLVHGAFAIASCCFWTGIRVHCS